MMKCNLKFKKEPVFRQVLFMCATGYQGVLFKAAQHFPRKVLVGWLAA